MSKQAAIQLLQQAGAKPELQAELEQALEQDEHVSAFLATAADRGYEFSAAEFREAVAEAEVAPATDGELDDSELDQVTGGLTLLRLPPRSFELGTRFSTRLFSRTLDPFDPTDPTKPPPP